MYFILFITTIMVLIWTFQVVSLQRTYEAMKTRDIVKISNEIIRNYKTEGFSDTLDSIAYNNNMCIELTDANGRSVYSCDMMAGHCLIHANRGVNRFKYMNLISESSENFIYYKVQDEAYNNNTLLFATTIGNPDNPEGFLFLNTSLQPLESTAMIIREQIFFIAIILIAIGLFISFFLSKLIATPIVRITKAAERLGNGDYNINFNGTGYEETEQLAETLNYASREISKVDNLRRDLVANISHDLRTPLTMVKAYAEMVRDLSGDNPVKRREHIDIIIEESDRLAALVNDILDISRIENGTAELHMTTYHITDELCSVLERYKLLEEQGYRFEFIHDENVTVSADMLKIQQVLFNLINNAVNYTGEDKRIIIRQINSDGAVRIEISDTGKGIPPEELPLIFDRYYRAEKNKREVVGTGLGLSIVKGILKKHGFPFGVLSTLNEGSTFWFEMTAVPEKEPTAG